MKTLYINKTEYQAPVYFNGNLANFHFNWFYAKNPQDDTYCLYYDLFRKNKIVLHLDLDGRLIQTLYIDDTPITKHDLFKYVKVGIEFNKEIKEKRIEVEKRIKEVHAEVLKEKKKQGYYL